MMLIGVETVLWLYSGFICCDEVREFAIKDHGGCGGITTGHNVIGLGTSK